MSIYYLDNFRVLTIALIVFSHSWTDEFKVITLFDFLQFSESP